MGAIFLQGMHVPAPKSRSFGSETLAISLGILSSEDCEKEGWCRSRRVDKTSRVIKKKVRFFILAIPNHFFAKILKRASRGLKKRSH
jgi:hypothetical protein